jgi:hypothetical protein
LDGRNKFGNRFVNPYIYGKQNAMTLQQIEVLFYETIEQKAVYNQLTGISEDKIYNWRKKRGAKPHTGDMLNVLYQLNKITINEPSPDQR